MEDDILEDLLGTSDLPKSEPSAPATTTAPKQEDKPAYKSKFNSNREDLWSDTSIGKHKPDPATFNKVGKSFLITLAGTPDEKAKEQLTKIVTTLGSKNFAMRYQFTDTISFLKTLADTDGLTVEAYLPWKKMAPDLEHVAKTFATKRAYEMACHYANKFNALPNAIRCFRANMMHAMLGPKLDNPVNLAICWSECGSEQITKETDFKKVGNLTNIFTPCRELNIPIYNIKNEDSLKKLVEYIKSL